MTKTKAGHFYGDDGRRLHDLGTTLDRVPDYVVCRRLEDFPNHIAPPGATIGTCSRCDRAIAFNGAKFPTLPRVCMQCQHVRPDPMDPARSGRVAHVEIPPGDRTAIEALYRSMTTAELRTLRRAAAIAIADLDGLQTTGQTTSGCVPSWRDARRDLIDRHLAIIDQVLAERG